MKNAKRWLAILLAVTLLCSNGIYQLGTTLSANETETTEEAQPEENPETVAGQTDGAIEDTGKATVQEVTPEEESGDSSAQDAETANVPEAAAQEDVQEGQNEATVQEPAAEAPAAEAPAAEGAGQAEEAAAPEVQTYNVKINKSELDGGQIKVWGSDNTQVDVTEYDGNNQYVKEVKEGEEFNFQITLKDGFDGAQVKVNNNDLAPESTDGNVITYKVAGINEEKVIDVTYNKVETPAEEEVKAEEPKEEDVAEEPEDNSVNTASLNENVSTVADTQKDTEYEKWIKVDGTVTLIDKKYTSTFLPNYNHAWRIKSGAEYITLSGTGSSATVQGIKEGTAKVEDKITWAWNNEKTIEYTIHVNKAEPKISITGADSVYIDQTISLTATVSGIDGSVAWSSSDSTIASVNQNGVVTGIKKGTVTIYAAVGTALLAEKKITVTRNETGGYYVYLYTKVTGDTTGLTLNKDGWYTLGRLWVSGIDDPKNYPRDKYYKSGKNWNAVEKALQNPNNFERYESNVTIDMSAVNWNYFGLVIADGATNYTPNGSNQWHLDGMSEVTSYGSVVINHYELGTNKKLAESETITAEENTVINGADHKKAIAGYTYTSANPEQYVIVKKSTGKIDLYYSKGTFGYTVKYLEKDSQKVIHPEKKGSGDFGDKITENAIEIPGYNKAEPIKQEITINITGNEITFYYTKRTDLDYTVKYLEKDTNKKLAEEKNVTGRTFGETATETAPSIDGYTVDAETKSVAITTGKNEITFYYTKRADLAYTVNYYEEGTTTKLHDSKKVENQTFGANVTEEAVTIPGYNLAGETSQTITIGTGTNEINFYYTKKTTLSYTVKYLEAGSDEELATSKTVENQTFGTEVTEKAIAINGYNVTGESTKTITIADGSNEIVFHYTKKNDLSYVVNYLEKDTNQKLADAKTETGKTYKDKVTEKAIAIDGYDLVGEATQNLTISHDNGKNVINFYYTKRTDLGYTVKYLEKETNKKLADEKTVTGQTFGVTLSETALEIDGYTVDAPTKDVTITTGKNEITFYYTKRADLAYTVKYLEKDTDTVLAAEKTVTGQTFGETATEKAEAIDGYTVDFPTKNVMITTGKNEITFYYTKSTNIIPTEPTTPTDPAAPTTPTTPAAPTTTPARPETRTTEPTGNAFIDNVVTPIVEKAEEKVAEIKEVFNSDDDDVPLADQKLDDNNDHKCCILHFLIMLITLLVYAFATKSMKKRQKKLHEVREELDCELAKRGLPLSTEKQ